MIQTFGKNEKGFDYVVGDIHGCFTRLQRMLDAIGFDEENDRLFSTGDLVDRGPDSHMVLDWLAKPCNFAVQGNHEWLCINSQNGGFYMGRSSEELYRDDGGEWFFELSEEKQNEIIWAFSNLPHMIEVQMTGEVYGIVHANVPFSDWDYAKFVINGNDESKKMAFKHFMTWDRTRFDSQLMSVVSGIDRVFVGHNMTEYPLFEGNMIYLDTGGVTLNTYKMVNGEPLPSPFEKGLTVMNMTTFEIYHEVEVV